MAEVNKELLRKLALEWIAASEKVDATDDDDDFLEFNAIDEVWQELADGREVLSLLDENAAQAARIAELERDKVRLESEAMYGAAGFQAAKERIAELERECERLRREFVEVEAERNAWRDGAKKIAVGRLDEIKEVQDLRDELEACRKDAGYWRYIRDRLGEPGDEVHVVFGEWCWAELPLEDVEAAIDAAMQEGGV